MNKNAYKLENFSNSVSKRPLMFLPTTYVGQMLKPLLMAESFLRLIIDSDCFRSSTDIRLHVIGEHFTFHANQSSFNLSGLTKDKSWSADQHPLEWILRQILPLRVENEYYAAFIQLMALVCLSDTCQLDLSFDTNCHLRQMFVKGIPVSNESVWLGDEMPMLFPYIRLSLTPRSDIFSMPYEESDPVLGMIDEFLSSDELTNLGLIRKINRKANNELEISINQRGTCGN